MSLSPLSLTITSGNPLDSVAAFCNCGDGSFAYLLAAFSASSFVCAKVSVNFDIPSSLTFAILEPAFDKPSSVTPAIDSATFDIPSSLTLLTASFAALAALSSINNIFPPFSAKSSDIFSATFVAFFVAAPTTSSAALLVAFPTALATSSVALPAAFTASSTTPLAFEAA